jgi:NhaC family Na+:H+ antiporter
MRDDLRDGPRHDDQSPISLGLACLPVVTMVVLFVLGATLTTLGTELLILVMLGAATVATWTARTVGRTWDDVQHATGEKLAAVLPAILILLAIGMLIATWIVSGTIALLVYYGLLVINPTYLVVTAFLATATMSICTGTSWGSAGTIGVALMGMATAVGAPLGPTAGAIVSGAYFGDKLSPLSDSTNISAIGAGADLYGHIRMMLYTAVPSFAIACAVYTLAVDFPSHNGAHGAQLLLDDLDSIFSLSPIALLPLVVVLIGVIKRTPPVIAMATSSVVAAGLAIAVQGFDLQTVLLSGVRGFDVSMLADRQLTGTQIQDATRTLLERGGLYSIANTLLMILAAFLLAGAMDVSGSLDRIVNRLLSAVRSTWGLVASTMAAGTTLISLTSHGGVTSLVVGELFGKAYDERDLARENLSRSIEDSVTIVEPLLPWTVSAVYMATTLGVPTITYAPWALFCIGGPVFSLLYAATFDRTGFGLKRREPAARKGPA